MHKNKKCKIYIVFHDMITHMLKNEKLQPVVTEVTELFISGRKQNKSLVFIPQSCFAVPRNIALNSTHYFIIKT